MFKPLVSHYDIKQLNDFSKAMINIRKGATTAKAKNDALKKQIGYFNVMTKTNFQFMNKPPKFLFSTKPLSYLSKADTNSLWKHLKPTAIRSKKSGLSLFSQMYLVLDFLKLSRPRVAAQARRAPSRQRSASVSRPKRSGSRAPAFPRILPRLRPSDSRIAAFPRILPRRSMSSKPLPRKSNPIIQSNVQIPPFPSSQQSKQKQKQKSKDDSNIPRDEDDEKGDMLDNNNVAQRIPRAQDYGVYHQFESGNDKESNAQKQARFKRNREQLMIDSGKARYGRHRSRAPSAPRAPSAAPIFEFNDQRRARFEKNKHDSSDINVSSKGNDYDSDDDVAIGLDNFRQQSKGNKKLPALPPSLQKQPAQPASRPPRPPRPPIQRSASAQSVKKSRKRIRKGTRNSIADLPKSWNDWSDDEKMLYRKSSNFKKRKMARMMDSAKNFKPSPNKGNTMLY